ncbi:SHQ1-domain-containing protein [Panaeolus papilionaceus]|nr:SHQ1-domain-containing protein [Panaeolus papilionaceus]
MLTPRFNCSQTHSSVIIKIYCPSIRANVEINVDETLVTVYVNPYFLRLNFSKPLIEDDDSSAQYDPGSAYLTVTLTKENKGVTFEDLDLLAKLLAPRPKPQATPTIEVLSSQQLSPDEELAAQTGALSLENEQLLHAAENDWQIPQELPENETIKTSRNTHYGFLDMHTGYLSHVSHTENEANELGPDAETLTPKERLSKRLQHEDEKWDEEHYMADFMDDGYIQELLNWSNPYITDNNPFEYTEKENAEMLRLPRKEYLPSPQQTQDIYLTLATLLFAYFYDSRTTQHDPTPESAWTISILTPAFTALDPPHSTHYKGGTHVFTDQELIEAIIPSYRRSLAFPLYRSWALSEKCREDTALILQKGKRAVTRCLLEMKDILDHHEVYYIYSKIWLHDFCVWIQAAAADDVLFSLGHSLMNLRLEKSAIGWGLDELELAAKEAIAREPDSDDE